MRWIGLAACVVLGIALGCMTAMRRVTPPRETLSTAIVMSVEPKPQPTTVTVRIESVPAGAAVMLRDDDRLVPLGTTPLDVQLDPSRSYDFEVTAAGHEVRREHVEPAGDRHVVFELRPVRRSHHRAIEAEPVEQIDTPETTPETIQLADRND
jgi:hypothetical protein